MSFSFFHSCRLPFIENGVLPFWYFFKTIYWHYSAMQIKSGYPKFNLGLFFVTKGYSLIHKYVCKSVSSPLPCSNQSSIDP